MSPENFQSEFGVHDDVMARLETYHDLLIKWQKAINLVSPGTLPHVWDRHFADSAQISKYISEGSKVVDLGSGGGFPALVLAITRPDLEFHLIESDRRKCEFLKNVSRETFTPVTIHNDRVQNVVKSVDMNLITARAYAPLIDIFESVDWGKKGTEMILLKGKSAKEEIEIAEKTYKFKSELFPSRSGDGMIVKVTKSH